jgi:NADPH-dependent dioxygenase
MTDVLIAGAGPVGLTLAHELLRRGVRVRVVDAAASPSATSRALATHARTLEIYDQMGVVGDILARGRKAQHFSIHRGGRRLVRFGPEYSRLPTRYPYTLVIDQALTEEVLREAVARQGVRVEWNTRLVSLDQDGTGVRALLRHADGTEETAGASWLAGCDGGHSTVRRELGLALAGDSTERWLIADAVVDMDLPADSLHLVHVGGGTVMAVPFPQEGKWRLLDTVDTGHADDPRLIAARFSRKITAGSGVPARVHEPTWVSVFDIQQRMIDRMRLGRCLVAGDAAHVHSPASGQGLNTGVQDAFNLAWKLAMVVRGEAAETCLDTYGAERVPVGARLLDATRTATGLVALKNAVQAMAMPTAFAVIRNVPGLQAAIERKIMRSMTALALDYADGPLTRRAPEGPGPRPGQRAAQVTEEEAGAVGWQAFLEELRDPRWTLLVYGVPEGGDWLERAAKEHGGWLSVRTAAGDAATGPGALADPGGTARRGLGLEPEGWLLVRPDGYLAARGDRLTEAEFRSTLRALPLPEHAS